MTRQAVQALEKHYSVTLVENRMNRLYLTEAGEQLRRKALRIVGELNRTEAVMEEYGTVAETKNSAAALFFGLENKSG